MIAFRSLAARLTFYVVIAQVIGFVATHASVHMLDAYGILPGAAAYWNDLAYPKVEALTIDSVKPAPDGSLRLDPTPELRAYLNRMPTLRLAAFDPQTMSELPGSAPDLASLVKSQKRIRLLSMSQLIEGEPGTSLRGALVLTYTPHGRVQIAIYGYVSSWRDFPSWMYRAGVGDVKYHFPEILVVGIIGWIALKRGLVPLDSLVRQAETIDLVSLDRRLSLNSAPSEIRPLVVSINDALKRLDEDAKRQRRFLANVAHELRTPVAILTERLDHPKDDGFVNNLKRDARRIRTIIEQLLASARLQARQDVSVKVDLVEVARSAVKGHALLAVKNGRHLAIELTQEPIIVVGDQLALESVIGNLIDNALRAEPEGGTVLVRVGADTTVEVIDHGEGIPELDQELIFEPFWRKTDAKPGTGLGLAIVKDLMNAHGGRIDVQETPGGGATFKLHFSTVDGSAISKPTNWT